MPSSLGPVSAREFAAVLFDLDGTLIDSTPAVERSWLRWAEEEGVDPARLRGSHGVPSAGIVARLLPEPRWAAASRRIEEIEVGDTDGITVLPGAAEALAALAGSDGHLGRAAIATSCTRPLARARMVATGLAQPRVVVTADDIDRGKPHPDPFLEAARRLGVDPADCLVVEDAPSGLAAAKAAGCTTLAVTTTTAREVLEADPNADAVVGLLSDVRFLSAGPAMTVKVTAP